MLGIIIFTSTAFILGIILTLTNYYLNRESKIEKEVVELLPGYNCGACGFGGCAGMAHNIVHNHVGPKQCKPMKKEQYDRIMDYLKKHHIIDSN